MKIVVLDGHTLNPGDLSWQALAACGSCEIYPRTTPEQVCRRAAGAEIIFTNKVVIDRKVLVQLPALRYIGVLATGYNVVDTGAARERGITVTHIPAYGTGSVAQMTIALLLELTRRAGDHSNAVKSGRWAASEDWCFWDTPQIELDGLTLGLIGYGRIARAVAATARTLGMHIIAYQPSGQAAGEIELTDCDTLFARADVISLHCPLTADNSGLVNARRLALMKPGSFLINTARGGLVNEADLAAALNEGHLAGAAVDVLATEPPAPDNPLIAAINCIITPHLAWATRAARGRLMHTAVENLRAFIDGRPVNVVPG